MGLLSALALAAAAVLAAVAAVQTARLELLRRRLLEHARRSAAVVSGRVAEQLVPFSQLFKYDPRDARFLGSPVDFVVFDGLEDGNLRAIVFVEVKKGSSKLSDRERQIKEAVERCAVKFDLIRVE